MEQGRRASCHMWGDMLGIPEQPKVRGSVGGCFSLSRGVRVKDEKDRRVVCKMGSSIWS